MRLSRSLRGPSRYRDIESVIAPNGIEGNEYKIGRLFVCRPSPINYPWEKPIAWPGSRDRENQFEIDPPFLEHGGTKSFPSPVTKLSNRRKLF